MRLGFEAQALAATRHLQFGVSRQPALGAACLCAGVAPLAGRWIPDEGVKAAYGLLLAAIYLGFAVLARRSAVLGRLWEVAFAFFILAVVQVLNNFIPGLVATSVLNDSPNPGNPFASTLSGSVVIQLVETLIAIVPVVVLTTISGADLASIYLRKRVNTWWLLFGICALAASYVFAATIPLRPGSFAERLLPTNGVITIDRLLTLSPALLIMVMSNGLQEEVLFRGLFLQKYNWLFGAGVANVLQALVFAAAHIGISYTPVALFFVVAVVFPLGLLAGYLMRTSNGVIVPTLVHAGLDIPIYLVFLSYTS
jgi:membrane protease YdiL (CAAX protease family)